MSTFQVNRFKTKHKTSLSIAISMALSLPVAQADTFNVTEAQDNGTGLIANTLSWAIFQANTTVGEDVIELNTNVSITGVMKRLIDSDTTLQSDLTRRTIDGNNQFRPLFVKSGQVTIQNLDIENGLAKGGGSGDGGNGAGLGGALFIYDGNVSLIQTNITNSSAEGGGDGMSGGGGMFGSGSFFGGGGGLFADAYNVSGGYGGYGNYRNNDTFFGLGGNNGFYAPGTNGGFGGGGGRGFYGDAGHGGFGGGGGYSYEYEGGNGGFAAGAGRTSIGGYGIAGFAANGQYAAGLGGGIFMRSGLLELNNVTISSSSANSSGQPPNISEGLGGGIFVLHTTSNVNGNNQGMPQNLPVVSGCGVVFNNNQADTDPDTSDSNNDVFDLAGLVTPVNGVSITEPCGAPDHEIQISGNSIEIIDGDTEPVIKDGTNMGQSVIGFTTASQIFSIHNLGNTSLILTSDPVISLDNNNINQFAITQLPESYFVLGGDFVNFEVIFTPTMPGVDTATVVIESNDIDENPYEFVIQAEAITPAPEVSVFGNSIEIIDGDDTPDANDFTSFGHAQESAQSITRTFSIRNNDTGVLNLSGTPIVELQNSSGQFSVSSQPQSIALNNGEMTTFDVTFTPISIGVDTATVVIQNNDLDEAPYDFEIEAEGIEQAPILQVVGNNIVINNYDIVPSVDDGTYMGQTPVNGGYLEKQYDLFNLGPVDLNISDILVVSQNQIYNVSSQSSNLVINPSSSIPLVIGFDPIEVGDSDFGDVFIYNQDNELIHTNRLYAFGQPTLTISAINNYVQEGESLSFRLMVDLPISANTFVYPEIVGDVQINDFINYDPNEYVYFGAGQLTKDFFIETSQDGIYEGTEFFQLSISLADPYNKFHVGFPSRVLGVIDDDLIFVDDFNTMNLNQLITGISQYAIDLNEVPTCDKFACNFLNRSITLDLKKSNLILEALSWFEETLLLMHPSGDWDGDGLPNSHDLNPFGLNLTLMKPKNLKHD